MLVFFSMILGVHNYCPQNIQDGFAPIRPAYVTHIGEYHKVWLLSNWIFVPRLFLSVQSFSKGFYTNFSRFRIFTRFSQGFFSQSKVFSRFLHVPVLLKIYVWTLTWEKNHKKTVDLQETWTTNFHLLLAWNYHWSTRPTHCHGRKWSLLRCLFVRPLILTFQISQKAKQLSSENSECYYGSGRGDHWSSNILLTVVPKPNVSRSG